MLCGKFDPVIASNPHTLGPVSAMSVQNQTYTSISEHFQNKVIGQKRPSDGLVHERGYVTLKMGDWTFSFSFIPECCSILYVIVDDEEFSDESIRQKDIASAYSKLCPDEIETFSITHDSLHGFEQEGEMVKVKFNNDKCITFINEHNGYYPQKFTAKCSRKDEKAFTTYI